MNEGVIKLSEKITKRTLAIADHIINTKDTIRATAKIFNVSKSTVHKDIQERLSTIDIEKYILVKEVMAKHLEMRHILGGESTRQLFLRKKQYTL